MSELFPSFEPDRDEPKKRRFRPIPFRLLAPNLVTLLALCLGLTAMRLVVEGKLELSVVCILIAAGLDGVDGRLARFLKGTSRFGAELDSLADFVNFGVAPAFVLWQFTLHDLRSVGWIIALIFAIAMVLRLARFNVSIDDPDRPDWQKNYFVGMPAPAGAVTAMLPLYLHFLGVPVAEYGAPLAGAYTLALAFLTISKVPMYAGKTLGARIPRHQVLPIFVGVILFAGLLAAYPFEVLSLLVILYFALVPLGVRRYRARERAEREAASAAQGAAIDPPVAETLAR